MKNKIKAVAFDVGGVLEWGNNDIISRRIEEDHSVHGYVAKKLKVDLDTYFDIIGSVHERSITGRVTRKRMIEIMTGDFNIGAGKLQKLYANGFKKVFKSNNELYRLAYKLKNRGYKIGIISDQWYLSKDNLIKPEKVENFDFVILSCDVKMRKPNKEIYKLALSKARVKPSEMVFIDNREWNTKSAEKLGINAILFKNNRQCVRDLRKLGVEA